MDAKLTIYRSSVLPSTFPCQCVIAQPKIITDPVAFADSMPHHARARPALGGHARRRWRCGCEVGSDDLQVFSFALHRSVPMRITQPIFFTDHFAFADSMPHHAVPRSADMPPLEMWMRSWKRRFTGLQFCPPPFRANA